MGHGENRFECRRIPAKILAENDARPTAGELIVDDHPLHFGDLFLPQSALIHDF